MHLQRLNVYLKGTLTRKKLHNFTFVTFVLCREKVDMWSAGIVLVMMLTGAHPFNTDDTTQLYEDINNGETIVRQMFAEYTNISDEAKQLVYGLIKCDP